MNLGHLLGFSLLSYVGTAVAQRQIHGVNGYYNWTPAQLEIGAKMEFGNEGTAVKNEDYRREYAGRQKLRRQGNRRNRESERLF